MKTNIMFFAVIMLLFVGAGTSVFAQGIGNSWGETVTVDGTLQLQNGDIVLVSGSNTYFVPMVTRYIGFIDGLKEGAAVSVQGYIGGYNNILMPTSMTINGKSYDLSRNAPQGGYGYGYGGGMMGGYNGGYCGNGGAYNGRHHGGGGRGRHW
jgi:hypothetical protein